MITIGERVADLMTEKGFTDVSLAAEINKRNDPQDISISKSTIGNIKNNAVNKNKKPKGFDYKYFVALADVFGVSVDYLLGLREERTTDPNIQNAVEYTGLSEKAAEILHNSMKTNPFMPLVISFLIESDSEKFNDGRISGTFHSLASAIWETFVKYPIEPRINAIDGTKYKENQLDVIGTTSNQKTTIDANIYPDAAFLSLLTWLKNLREQEISENPSEYKEKYIDTVRKKYGGADNGKHN
jgi:transcriptional regulator with XRE-family HTH domain